MYDDELNQGKLEELEVEIQAMMRLLGRTNPLQTVVTRSILIYISDLERQKKQLQK